MIHFVISYLAWGHGAGFLATYYRDQLGKSFSSPYVTAYSWAIYDATMVNSIEFRIQPLQPAGASNQRQWCPAPPHWQKKGPEYIHWRSDSEGRSYTEKNQCYKGAIPTPVRSATRRDKPPPKERGEGILPVWWLYRHLLGKVECWK